jgi:hypothetical protein
VSAGTDSGAEKRRTLFTDSPNANVPSQNGSDAQPHTPVHQGRGSRLEIGVRQPQATPCGTNLLHDVPPTPAHPQKSLVAQLNRNWRVMDDPLQWILQRRKGNPRKKNSGWRDRSFCQTREGLLRCVREYCGDVDAGALAQLEALPDYHLDWKPREIAERT